MYVAGAVQILVEIRIVRSPNKTFLCSLPCRETVTRGSPTDALQGAYINTTAALSRTT